jgi:RNA polymerase sigma-70 factor (ECF subfamily)
MAEQPSSQAGRGQDDEELQKVRQALDRLPSRYREPAVLWYLQELPTDQICQVLGINRNTLHVRLTRAREKLRGLLAGLEDGL